MSQTLPPAAAGASPGLTPGLVRIMAVASGLAVAGNYYVQPLLPAIAADLGISTTRAGAIVTVAQLSYALGLLLLVPLGDVFERRRLIVVMTMLAGFGLLTTALAPSLTWIFVGTTIAGLFSVVAQLLVPFAATLAAPAHRGKVLGIVMSGLLLGILLARTVAGGLAGLGGWHTVYWVGAAAMFATAVVLARSLPAHPSSASLSYPRLLWSVLVLFRDEPVLRVRAVLGASAFASFSILWTSIAFLLAAPPYEYSIGVIGLFGLAGAAGALSASAVGRLADRGTGDPTLPGIALLLCSWLPLAWGATSLVPLIVGVLVLDLASQAIHVSNQGALYRIRPEARSRLTSGYMTCYFIGGAGGSLLSAWSFNLAGWLGVCVAGALVSSTGLVAWLLLGRARAMGGKA